MSNLSARLDHVRQARLQSRTTSADTYRSVLDEFATFLSQNHLGVDAWISNGSVPQVSYLNVAPSYRRSERNIMLSFWRTSEGIECTGSKFTSSTDLESYLVEFYKNPNFAETLQHLAERSTWPVIALLRQSENDYRSDADEYFEVPNDGFRHLVDAKPGTKISLTVAWQRRGYGEDRSRSPTMLVSLFKSYRFLIADGFGVEIEDVSASTDYKFVFVGVVIKPGSVR
jgi:hypothetical protein